jgi:hypothetical protein
MGWAAGSDVAREVVKAIVEADLPVQKRRPIYRALIRALEECDWDTQPEARGLDPVFDDLLGKA